MISDLVALRLPKEAELLASQLNAIISEALGHYGYTDENNLTDLQRSMVADKAALALIPPALSHYAQEMLLDHEGAKEEIQDKVKFLKMAQTNLKQSLAENEGKVFGGSSEYPSGFTKVGDGSEE
jgi:hypothetical protein